METDKKPNQYMDCFVDLPNGEKLCYRKIGTGPILLLFLHDLRGFGNSSYINKITKLQDFANDLKLFLDSINIKRITLVGWSLGGAVSMCFSSLYPSFVEKLVLYCSVHAGGHQEYYLNPQSGLQEKRTDQEAEKYLKDKLVPIFESKNYLAFMQFLFRNDEFYKVKTNAPPLTKEQTDELSVAWLSCKCYVESTLSLHTMDIKQEVKNIQCPVLIYQGELDNIILPELAYDNAKLIGLEKCKIIMQKDRTHIAHCEDPEQFSTTLQKFFKNE